MSTPILCGIEITPDCVAEAPSAVWTSRLRFRGSSSKMPIGPRLIGPARERMGEK